MSAPYTVESKLDCGRPPPRTPYFPLRFGEGSLLLKRVAEHTMYLQARPPATRLTSTVAVRYWLLRRAAHRRAMASAEKQKVLDDGRAPARTHCTGQWRCCVQSHLQLLRGADLMGQDLKTKGEIKVGDFPAFTTLDQLSGFFIGVGG